MKECVCTPLQIQRYLPKISGPLLDRIDLHIDVPEVNYKELTGSADGEPSRAVAARVQKARDIQLDRFGEKKSIFCNAQMGPREIKKYCRLDDATKRILESAIDKLGSSARAYHWILKVSRSIADLAGEEKIRSEHASEAIQYRSLDRNFWQTV